MREEAENDQARASLSGNPTASAPSSGAARTRRQQLAAALRAGHTGAAEKAIETWRGQADARDWIHAALASGTTPEHLRPVLKEIAAQTDVATRTKWQTEIARRCRHEYLARDQVILVGPEAAFSNDYRADAAER